jgi:crotonobetainyl-CoA:carnitine CoA-transferase CaiB-like acyl-CoA transferase
MEQPFDGARVVEVGDGVAVAAAANQFSDFGARVVKVERPGGGELRRLAPFAEDRPHLETGGMHLALDTGKRSLALDVGTPSGREVLTRLAAGADLLLVELPPDEALRVLDAGQRAVPPPSTVAITPHGLNGPYRDRRESEMSVFAWSTRMARQRPPDGPPLRYAPHTAAMQVGFTAAAVGAAALWDRERGGERRDADVSAVEAHSGNVDTTFTPWSLNQGIAPTSATRSVRIFPVGTYRCLDGFVQFTAGEPPFFQRSCAAIGHPEWPEDPRFRDPATRADYHDDYMAAFLPWIGERTKLQVFREMQGHGVLCTPVLTVEEAVAEPQAVARRSFVTVEQPEVGEMLLAGAPFRLGGVEGDAWRALPAPRLGEHNAELLDELGYSADEQIALFRAGVTG